jgi:L-alanine-DL-glutamate epimerase-like enolase superfamily enzyme
VTGAVGPPVEGVTASAFTIPADAPESDGTLAWDATTVVVAEARAGRHSGLGYAYGSAAAAGVMAEVLAPVVRGADALAPPAAWRDMVAAVRNVGRAGVASTAVSAVDVALWDLKARILGVALADLLGRVREGVPAYGSGGFTSYGLPRLRSQLAGWAEQGLAWVKMKVGRDPGADPARVAAARAAVGDEVGLMVDANGAYGRREALAQAERFAEHGVCWLEEPVSSEDLEGLRLVRDRAPAPMEVAAGEYAATPDAFRRLLEAGAVDCLQADATRCGGVTGFMAAAALCGAHHAPLSAHTAPALHAHLGAAALPLRHVELFHDHARVERMLFDGVPALRDGALWPDRGRPGLGLELRRRDAERHAA